MKLTIVTKILKKPETNSNMSTWDVEEKATLELYVSRSLNGNEEKY